jgi:hypothetical protein
MNNSDTTKTKQLNETAVSGSFFDILETIHDNLIDKGLDCYNSDGSIKEVDEYKLTFKIVADELEKYNIKDELKKLLKNKLIVNGFEINQMKNSDGNYLSHNFLQWSAKDLFSDLMFIGQNKKECISWAKNYR